MPHRPIFRLFAVVTFAIGLASSLFAQSTAITDEAALKSATEWTADLQLSDAAQLQRVTDAIATHLQTVRAWHNDHPADSVPAGINPLDGKRLSDLDRSIIADSALPRAVHDALMTALRADLTETQVEAILDRYTIGKVAFTLKGYQAIVTDLTPEEEATILANLKEARERAIDFKNMKQISAIFEIYKTKNEQFLNANGRDWHALYKAYAAAAKARKAAASKP
jgi:hypothetical protein